MGSRGRARWLAVVAAVGVLLVLLWSPEAAVLARPVLGARDRVVASDGTDDGPGTADAPWRTLQHAADALEPGGTAWIRSGTYAGFRLERSGEPFAPLTFGGWRGDPMPFLAAGIDGRIDAILLRGVTDVRLRGLEVTGGTGDEFTGNGIRVENGSARVELAGNLVTGNDGAGIAVSDSTLVLIVDNEVSHNAAGVRLSGAGEGTEVRGNRIHHTDRMLRDTPEPDDDAGGDAITLDGTTGGVLVTGNTIWGNRARSTDYGWDGGAFSIYGASNARIEGNVAWDNENVLETGTDPGVPCADNRFVRNVASGRAPVGLVTGERTGDERVGGLYLRCGEGMLVAHNTLRDLDFGFSVGPDSDTYSGSIEGLRILANIVDLHASGGTLFGLFEPLPASLVIDFDLVRTTGTVARIGEAVIVDFPAFQAQTGYEEHGRWGDPRFAGPVDATLRAGSPAIDAVPPITGVGDGASGAGPDLGALERPGP